MSAPKKIAMVVVGAALLGAAGFGAWKLAEHKGIIAKPEVFLILPGGGQAVLAENAADVAKSLGYRLATVQEITDAQKAGAQWCRSGWVQNADKTVTRAIYPQQASNSHKDGSCGAAGLNDFAMGTPPTAAICVFGKKPEIKSDYTNSVFGMKALGNNLYVAFNDGQSMGPSSANVAPMWFAADYKK